MSGIEVTHPCTILYSQDEATASYGDGFDWPDAYEDMMEVCWQMYTPCIFGYVDHNSFINAPLGCGYAHPPSGTDKPGDGPDWLDKGEDTPIMAGPIIGDIPEDDDGGQGGDQGGTGDNDFPEFGFIPFWPLGPNGQGTPTVEVPTMLDDGLISTVPIPPSLLLFLTLAIGPLFLRRSK